ncbi:hypothetical protein HU230_0038035 [Bradyrhizobium quebecense]|uniref:Uncharacterized protein n=1 Tax=Bradyrhizobium quebecense TaxID=2748629 RepID=A0A973WTC8_9BRAD|nr:hypothetical protein [Bradyrhizobium quebecense]UGA48814.1 hypothetical protein HU230_0038035 [Bradyrhizobium quebecense]
MLHVKLGHKSIQLDAGKAMDGTLDQAERVHIVRALERSGWRVRGVNGVAGQLGVKPTTLESGMEQLGIVQAR